MLNFLFITRTFNDPHDTYGWTPTFQSLRNSTVVHSLLKEHSDV